jgi:hypothetical protein
MTAEAATDAQMHAQILLVEVAASAGAALMVRW